MTTIPPLTKPMEALALLAERLTIATEQQLADAFWRGDRANTRRGLADQVQAGFIERLMAVARPVSKTTLVFIWEPGQPAPNAGALSYRLRSRWTRLPARQVACYVATTRGRALLGAPGRCRFNHPSQATHDLALAQVWVNLHCEAPSVASRWRGEHSYAEAFSGTKRPDAIVFDEAGQPDFVAECVGGFGYEPARIAAFHNFCANTLQLPYRLYG